MVFATSFARGSKMVDFFFLIPSFIVTLTASTVSFLQGLSLNSIIFCQFHRTVTVLLPTALEDISSAFSLHRYVKAV